METDVLLEGDSGGGVYCTGFGYVFVDFAGLDVFGDGFCEVGGIDGAVLVSGHHVELVLEDLFVDSSAQAKYIVDGHTFVQSVEFVCTGLYRLVDILCLYFYSAGLQKAGCF